VRLRRLRSGTLAVVRLRRRRGLDSFPVPPPVPVTHPVDAAHPPADFDDGPPDLERSWRLTSANPDRPMPGANAWPDDAVLLTYAELRSLIALHLDLARNQMPNTQPWGWVKERARAMRDGETPLLLSEVMKP
jgi:hypothetical protein